jgi:NADH:ubiquinone oxidoreductase subunit C
VRTEWLAAGEWRARAERLLNEGWLLSDLAGVDTLGLEGREPRFEIVVQFLKIESKDRVMIHVAAEGDPPTVPSITRLWRGANFFEREAYDMFGIVFEGHPNLTRILMPDEWEGYPLRKDYGVGKVVVDFKPQPFVQIQTQGQDTPSIAAGRKLDRLGQPVTDGGGTHD